MHVVDASRRKRRNSSVYRHPFDVNLLRSNPVPMTMTRTTADRCRPRQPRSRCLSLPRHYRRFRDFSRGQTLPDLARWQSSKLHLTTSVGLSVGAASGRKGPTARAAIRRGEKLGGWQGDIRRLTIFGGRQNCNPPRAPITHATPLICTTSCETSIPIRWLGRTKQIIIVYVVFVIDMKCLKCSKKNKPIWLLRWK